MQPVVAPSQGRYLSQTAQSSFTHIPITGISCIFKLVATFVTTGNGEATRAVLRPLIMVDKAI